MNQQQLDKAMTELQKKVNLQRERIELLTTAIHQLHKDSKSIIDLIKIHEKEE